MSDLGGVRFQELELLDRFAAAALTGILSGYPTAATPDKDIAQSAYNLARAMLEVRAAEHAKP